MKDFVERLGLDPETFEWQALGLCVGVEPEVFHSLSDRSPRIRNQAVAICDACPMQQICLEEGIRNKEYGIWGGKRLERGVEVND